MSSSLKEPHACPSKWFQEVFSGTLGAGVVLHFPHQNRPACLHLFQLSVHTPYFVVLKAASQVLQLPGESQFFLTRGDGSKRLY